MAGSPSLPLRPCCCCCLWSEESGSGPRQGPPRPKGEPPCLMSEPGCLGSEMGEKVDFHLLVEQREEEEEEEASLPVLWPLLPPDFLPGRKERRR